MEAAEDVSVVPGDQLVLGQPEAAAASPALVETPAVWAVERGLGQATQQGEDNQVLHVFTLGYGVAATLIYIPEITSHSRER